MRLVLVIVATVLLVPGVPLASPLEPGPGPAPPPPSIADVAWAGDAGGTDSTPSFTASPSCVDADADAGTDPAAWDERELACAASEGSSLIESAAASDAKWRAGTSDSMDDEEALAEPPDIGHYVWRGFNTRQQVDMADPEIARSMDALVETNSNMHRLLVHWADIQPAGPRQWEWDAYDRVVREAAERGVHLILTPTGSPNWARVPSRRNASPWHHPDNVWAWSAFVRRLAARYSAYAFELWNEPNHAFFWGGKPSPGGFAELYCRAAREIKAIRPTWVGGPGLQPLAVEATERPRLRDRWSASLFLKRALTYGIGRCGFDFVGYHAYAIDAHCRGKNPSPADTPTFRELRRVRGVMKAAGYGERAVWNTEWGFPSATCGYTRKRQAELVGRQERYLASLPYIAFSIYFNPWDTVDPDDPPAPTREKPLGFDRWDVIGVLANDWSAKPSFQAFGSPREAPPTP